MNKFEDVIKNARDVGKLPSLKELRTVLFDAGLEWYDSDERIKAFHDVMTAQLATLFTPRNDAYQKWLEHVTNFSYQFVTKGKAVTPHTENICDFGDDVDIARAYTFAVKYFVQLAGIIEKECKEEK